MTLPITGGGQGAPGAVMLADFVTDSFTESGDTALASHVPEVGTSIAVNGAYSANATVGGSVDKVFGTGTSQYYYSDSPPSDAYYIQATFFRLSSFSCNAGILVRQSTGTDTSYSIRLNDNGAGTVIWELRRKNADASESGFTILATHTGDLPTIGGAGVIVKLEIITADASTVNLKVSFDGVQVMNVDDTHANRILTTGKAGLRFAGVSSATVGIHVDSLSAR